MNQGGTRAQFKGSGLEDGELAPNGQPYKFMVWATDGKANSTEPGTFRIEIWYETEGIEVVVYDNSVEQAIEQGSITVRSK